MRLWEIYSKLLGLATVSHTGEQHEDKRTLPSERIIPGDVNAFLLAVSEEVVLREIRVQLHLVHGRLDARCGDELLEVLRREVRDSDVPDLYRAYWYGVRAASVSL